MLENFVSLGTILHVLTGKLNHEVIAFYVFAAATILLFCLVILICRLTRRTKKKQVLPSPANNLPALTDKRNDGKAQDKQADSPSSSRSPEASLRPRRGRASTRPYHFVAEPGEERDMEAVAAVPDDRFPQEQRIAAEELMEYCDALLLDFLAVAQTEATVEHVVS